jgi:hypothetical protein
MGVSWADAEMSPTTTQAVIVGRTKCLLMFACIAKPRSKEKKHAEPHSLLATYEENDWLALGWTKNANSTQWLP